MYAELANAGLQIYSAYQASKGQKEANDSQQAFNAAEAQKQRDYEERMATTRYQYTRRDLEAAGYNPLLAMNLNPPVPSGASASANPQSTTAESSRIISNSAKSIAETSLTGALRAKAAAESASASAAARIAQQHADIATSPLGKKLAAYRYFLDTTGAGKAASNLLNVFGVGKFFKGAKGSIQFGNMKQGFYGSYDRGSKPRYRPDRSRNRDWS